MTDENRLTLSTRVDRNGRIVLPAAARRALGVTTGDALVVQIEDGTVRLRTFADTAVAARAKLRDALGAASPGDLAQELVALRRQGLWRE
jgi:AbrB family looped-hinge helix DNA binding protein